MKLAEIKNRSMCPCAMSIPLMCDTETTFANRSNKRSEKEHRRQLYIHEKPPQQAHQLHR